MPGFIDQHLHPVLGALTLAIEVIAPEDWVLPDRTCKAAATRRITGAAQGRRSRSSQVPNDWL